AVAPGCGAPADAVSVQITAAGDFPDDQVITESAAIGAAGALQLPTIPLDTRVLQVTVLGDSGTLTIGKTAPFDLDELSDGDPVPVFMAPPDGLCPTGPPLYPRAEPVLARAGTGVLIVGGIGPDEVPVTAVEHYGPHTGIFTELGAIDYSPAEQGLLGASATALNEVPRGDGSADPGPGAGADATGPVVVIAGGGGPGYQIIDATDGTLSAEFLLNPGRARHGAVALDGQRVLLVGGCGLPLDENEPGQCVAGRLLDSTTIIDLSAGGDAGEVRAGPTLQVVRRDPTVVREAEGSVLIIGGTDDSGQAVTAIERLTLDDDMPGGGVSVILSIEEDTASGAVAAVPA
ncbi:MAG: hypothetical protein AAGC55_34095, partial [Myxococcota bacterium]